MPQPAPTTTAIIADTQTLFDAAPADGGYRDCLFQALHYLKSAKQLEAGMEADAVVKAYYADLMAEES